MRRRADSRLSRVHSLAAAWSSAALTLCHTIRPACVPTLAGSTPHGSRSKHAKLHAIHRPHLAWLQWRLAVAVAVCCRRAFACPASYGLAFNWPVAWMGCVPHNTDGVSNLVLPVQPEQQLGVCCPPRWLSQAFRCYIGRPSPHAGRSQLCSERLCLLAGRRHNHCCSGRRRHALGCVIRRCFTHAGRPHELRVVLRVKPRRTLHLFGIGRPLSQALACCNRRVSTHFVGAHELCPLLCVQRRRDGRAVWEPRRDAQNVVCCDGGVRPHIHRPQWMGHGVLLQPC